MKKNIDYDQNFFNLIDALNLIVNKYKIPIIVSTHPRTQKVDQIKVKINPLIKLIKPLGFNDF